MSIIKKKLLKKNYLNLKSKFHLLIFTNSSLLFLNMKLFHLTFTELQDFHAFVVRIQSQMRIRDFTAWSAQNITALTTAKNAMTLQRTNTQDTQFFHLAQGKLIMMYDALQ